MIPTPIHSMLVSLAAVTVFAASANADPVLVTINGVVEFSQAGGVFSGVGAGDDAVIAFELDSDLFLDGSFPTRGYEINQSSFALTLGDVTVGLQDPYPAGETPYFVLRDNDPAVDGFFLAAHPDAFPSGLPTEVPGVFEQFGAAFSVSYTGDTLSSLDILDAAGTYDFTGLKSFFFALTDGPFDAAFMIFDSMTIAVIPAPSAAALLAPILLARRRRRR